MKKALCSIVTILFANLIFAQVPVKNVSGNLVGTINWVKDTIYKLQGKVYVKAGSTLNIAPGTIIKGDKSVPGSALIVVRGARIYAIGTPTDPIIFTSSEPAGSRTTGDWGGIVIAGNASNNIPGGIGTLEGGNLANPDGNVSDGQYGGLNDLDNSGELRYVRIEFAGFQYAVNNELNGLTLASVGSGTKISYIQVSHGFDDAFEWFGGTVNCDHLISFRGNDDDFDTDFGYRGNVQFGIAMRDTAFADAVSGANGFESDNDGTGTGNMPYTSPVFSNMTIIGPQQSSTTVINTNFKRGAHIRRNSRQSVFNSIFMGWPVGVKIDGDSCHVSATNGNLTFKNNAMADCALQLDSTAGTLWNISPWYYAVGNANTLYPSNASLQLTAPFNYSSPDYRPSIGSPMLTGASFTDPKLVNMDNTPTYIGAFGSTDWTAGWTNFEPQNSPYIYPNGVYPDEVNSLVDAYHFNVYPTITSDVLNVAYDNYSGDINFIIYDMQGKMVYTKDITSNNLSNIIKLNMHMLNNGLYLLKTTINHQSHITKFSILK